MAKRMMHLVGHLATGPILHHVGAWRHPDSDADLILSPERYEQLARLYERGMFDGVFLVDTPHLPGLTGDGAIAQVESSQITLLDPTVVLAQMARVTEHLGLTATISTLLVNPYTIARQLATLDHLSNGRAGWNIVTAVSPLVTDNFGYTDLPEKEERYDHADEVVEACLELWSTWGEDALKVDRATGRFADPAKIRYVRYEGDRVSLRGGLTTPRSPQTHPVLMQAGSSPRGRRFAARWAEAIFTLQWDKQIAREFYADLKNAVVDAGRAPESCAILPAVEVFVDTTEARAQEQAERLDSLADDRSGLAYLSRTFDVDLSEIALDTPISQVPSGPHSTTGLRENALRVRVGDREATLGEVAHLQATTWLSPRLVGTAEDIADQLQERLESECCDGFVITHALSPGNLERFVDLVVPELQRRGVYRRRYAGATFRENLHDNVLQG